MGDTALPIALRVSNYLSAACFVMELFLACIVLYRICFKNQKSRSIIAAIVLIILACICLIVYYTYADLRYYDTGYDWDFGECSFYLFCYDLPYLLLYLAHWIVFFQYLEVAMILPVLLKISDYA